MSEEFNLYAKDDDPRSEKTLSAILGNYDGELDNPESRVEAYLLAIKEMLEGGGGGGSSVTVDTELKPNSTNPVQNKAIYEAIATTIVSLRTNLMGRLIMLRRRSPSRRIILSGLIYTKR